MALAEPVATVARVTWNDALARMAWRQGEHITLIGPTGVGKTELTIELLRSHRWAIFFSTKRIDKTLTPLEQMGFRKIHSSLELNPDVHSRYIVTPPWARSQWAGLKRVRIPDKAIDEAHARVFSEVLTRAFWQTGWTVAIDELEYINRDLRITSPVDRLLRQGRSQGNTMILGTQRPRHVTLHAYEQATHLFIWKQSDQSNVERAAELTGMSRRDVSAIVATLGHHDVLYVNTITGIMFTTNTRL